MQVLTHTNGSLDILSGKYGDVSLGLDRNLLDESHCRSRIGCRAATNGIDHHEHGAFCTGQSSVDFGGCTEFLDTKRG